MKKLLVFLMTVAVGASCFSQETIRANRIIADGGLFPPVVDTVLAPGRIGELRNRILDGHLYRAISLIPGAKRWGRVAMDGDAPTSFDTTNIEEFSVKVRSLLSGTGPISYDNDNGVISINGLSSYGSSGQLPRSTGSGWEYFTPAWLSPSDTVNKWINIITHVGDSLHFNIGGTWYVIGLQKFVGSVGIGNPTSTDANNVLVVRNKNNTAGQGIKIMAQNESAYTEVGWGKIGYGGEFDVYGGGGVKITSASSVTGIKMNSSGKSFFGANTNATAYVHIKAGSSAANDGQLKFENTTTLPTTPETGLVNFKNGLLFLDSSTSNRDTIATREWTRGQIPAYAIPSLAQVLAAGSNLTANAVITGSNSYNFIIDSSFFEVKGVNGSGPTIPSGTGSRMYFSPRKGAFRAGYVAADQWDDANVGAMSTAFGHSNLVKGGYSVAFGNYNTVLASSSTALGSNNLIGLAAAAAFVVGQSNESRTVEGMAIGRNLLNKHYHSFIIGTNNDTSNAANSGDWDLENKVFQIGIGNPEIGSRVNGFEMRFSGKARLNQYGAGNFTGGTATYALHVTEDGDIIEGPVTSGGSDGYISAGSFDLATSMVTLTQVGAANVTFRIPPSYYDNPIIADSLMRQLNDSTVLIKAVRALASNSMVTVTPTYTDSTVLFTIGVNPANFTGIPQSGVTNLVTDLAAKLNEPSGNGIVVRTGSGTVANRTLTGTTNQVTVINGDGVSGNPTFSLPQSINTGASVQFSQFQAAYYGMGTAPQPGVYGFVSQIGFTATASSSPAAMNLNPQINIPATGTHAWVSNLELVTPFGSEGGASITNTAVLKVGAPAAYAVTGTAYSAYIAGRTRITGVTTLDAPGNSTNAAANIDAAQTFINKRWIPRIDSTTSSATPTINTDNVDIYKLTAQGANITSFTTNLTGTPRQGEMLEIQITGTASRTLTFGSSFVATTVPLPTTTSGTATLTVIFQYYTTSSYGNNKWNCVNYY